MLDDLSGRYRPDEWAAKAIEAYHRFKADRIVAEINMGGQMVAHTLRVQDPNISFMPVHASRGKVTRAEPIAALYEQRRVHHVGTFAELEDQLCSFTSGFDRGRGGSPDRLDALVWAITELIVAGSNVPLVAPIVVTAPRQGVGYADQRNPALSDFPWARGVVGPHGGVV